MKTLTSAKVSKTAYLSGDSIKALQTALKKEAPVSVRKAAAAKILPARNDSFTGTRVMKPQGKPSKRIAPLLELISAAKQVR